jgi:selT/selW/selH-like putative selenoprotein
LARQIITHKRPGTEVNLRKSSGGVFEMTVDGALRFSKKAAGRFPTDEEILAAIG